MPEPAPRGHLVAVIGGATAGAEVAGRLAERGVRVVVFEMNPRPFGKIEDGLPRWHVGLRQKEYETIREKLSRPGVEFVPNTASFPSSHPLYRGQMMRSQQGVRDTLDNYDLLFSVGGDMFTWSLPSKVKPMPPGMALIHLDTDPWQIGKTYPAQVGILGDPKATLPDITAALREGAWRRGVEVLLSSGPAAARPWFSLAVETADPATELQRAVHDCCQAASEHDTERMQELKHAVRRLEIPKELLPVFRE